MADDKCPCGSGKSYAECCEPIIKGVEKAKTAEALMRARYTSYVKHEIDFIVKSCYQAGEQSDIDIEATRQWSEESTWHGLKIMRTEKGGENDEDGWVEFTASYTQKGMKDDYLEQAHFKKVNGEWLYDQGNLIPTTIKREGRKIGRNEKCPCGSGKKYKQCCGR